MRSRLIPWIFAAFALGFLLPVLACYGLVAVTSVAMVGLGAAADTPGLGLGGGPAVAVIEVQGQIVMRRGDSVFSTTAVAAADEILGYINQAAEDESVKSILLRVDSPGGSVVASDLILHALEEADKPVVVLMGQTAASGGYYISAKADWIFANPSTLTGSIGVTSQFINSEELLDKLGVEVQIIKSGPSKDFGSPFREMSPEERQYWESLIDEVYEGFVQIVVDGRDLTEEEVRDLADGRVFTGLQALELGLVDQLGYEQEAIDKAAELGGIQAEPRLLRFERAPSLFDLLQSRLAGAGAFPGPADVLEWMPAPWIEYRFRGP